MMQNGLSIGESGEKLLMYSMDTKMNTLIDIVKQQAKDIKYFKEELEKL